MGKEGNCLSLLTEREREREMFMSEGADGLIPAPDLLILLKRMSKILV